MGDLGSVSGLGRSLGEGKGYPLQYSGLEDSMACIVHGVSKSSRRLSDFHFEKLYFSFMNSRGQHDTFKKKQNKTLLDKNPGEICKEFKAFSSPM